MATNPWGTEENPGNGSIFGTGDVHLGVDAGQMDAAAIQNGSHTGRALSEADKLRIQNEVAQMVTNGQDANAILSHYRDVDSKLIESYVAAAVQRNDWNIMDNRPGPAGQQAAQEQNSQGFFSGMMSGIMGMGAAIGGALGTAKDTVVGLGQRLLNSGVEMEPRDISLAELGTLVPNVQVGKGRSVDGPQIG